MRAAAALRCERERTADVIFLRFPARPDGSGRHDDTMRIRHGSLPTRETSPRRARTYLRNRLQTAFERLCRRKLPTTRPPKPEKPRRDWAHDQRSDRATTTSFGKQTPPGTGRGASERTEEIRGHRRRRPRRPTRPMAARPAAPGSGTAPLGVTIAAPTVDSYAAARIWKLLVGTLPPQVHVTSIQP